MKMWWHAADMKIQPCLLELVLNLKICASIYLIMTLMRDAIVLEGLKCVAQHTGQRLYAVERCTMLITFVWPLPRFLLGKEYYYPGHQSCIPHTQLWLFESSHSNNIQCSMEFVVILIMVYLSSNTVPINVHILALRIHEILMQSIYVCAVERKPNMQIKLCCHDNHWYTFSSR